MKIVTTLAALGLTLWAGLAMAQVPGEPGKVLVHERADSGVVIQVLLVAATPYRVFTLDEPRRLVLDFQSISGFDVSRGDIAGISAVRTGRFQSGWTRIVADLEQPLAVLSAELKPVSNDIGQVVEIVLELVSDQQFSERSVLPPAEVAEMQETDEKPAGARRDGEGVVLVALDPGHGGVDPGANRDGITEKDIVLGFGLELQKQLETSGHYSVVMTRSADEFVSLRERVERARSVQAVVMISLHVNTVTKGRAAGAAVYVLGEAGEDSEADATAAFENSADMNSGLVPEGTETDIVRVLTDMARVETNARSALLAQNLIEGLRASVGVIRSRPNRAGEFRVLQAPDMPSVLLELGFLSDAGDRADLMSPEWRRLAARGIVHALDAWIAADAKAAQLARQ